MLSLKRLSLFILLIYITTSIVLLFPKFAKASSILFTDDFSDGIADGWTVTSGNSYLEVNSGRYGGIVTPNFTVADSVAGDELWTNYSYEIDIMSVQGGDVNLLFRYLNSSHRYGFHISSNSIKLEKVSPETVGHEDVKSEPIIFEYNTLYHIRIDMVGNNIKIYQNNNLVLEYNDPDPMLSGKIGIRVGTGGIAPSEVWFDNVKVTQLPDEVEPVLPVLTVPSLKQYQEPWKNKLYAHTRKTIEEFGCALTSAAMVLQYHNHNIMPDTLNDWLKQQPDGYLSNNLINWLAISRYTKEHYTPTSKTLEYKKINGTHENLDNELNNNHPAILKENGHYIVATGKTTTSYLINDPGYADRTDLSPYGNSFLAINSYTPTDSDLSYMMFITDPDINIELKTSNGSIIPTNSYIEDPVTSITNPTRKSGNPIKIYLFEKPANGKYTLQLTGPKGKYNLDSYLYDIDGKVIRDNFQGNLKGNDIDTFNISYEGKYKINEKRKRSDFKFLRKDFWKFFKNWH